MFLLMMLGFLGCKSIRIDNAQKKYFKKGIKQGKDYINYSFKITSDKEFIVKNISLENNPEKLEYFYKNEKGESSFQMMNPFPKGTYIFKFKTYTLGNFSKNEFLIFDYIINGKKLQKKTTIISDEIKHINK